MTSKVEISAHHLHLTKVDYQILFGESLPTKLKELGQEEIACNETVKVVGAKSEISNVRLLIPFREYSQLEISKTDAINLGINAPLKASGDLPGAMVKIVGPKGEINKEIAIVAKRHLHISTEEATDLNLKNNDLISLKISGDRALTFENIIVRVKENFSKTVHLDTDEANAAGLSGVGEGEIII